jgi:hypothetical protein
VPNLIFWLVGNELNKDASTIAIRKTALLLILYLFYKKNLAAKKMFASQTMSFACGKRSMQAATNNLSSSVVNARPKLKRKSKMPWSQNFTEILSFYLIYRNSFHVVCMVCASCSLIASSITSKKWHDVLHGIILKDFSAIILHLTSLFGTILR